MNTSSGFQVCAVRSWAVAALLVAGLPTLARSTEVVMKDGRRYVGRVAPVPGIAKMPEAASQNARPKPLLILMVDDDLRRYFVPRRRVVNINEGRVGQIEERIEIPQRGTRGVKEVATVGTTLEVEPFDKWGRRTFWMQTQEGRTSIIQGITLITPRWTRIEGLRYHKWDMRVATSSIPIKELNRVLDNRIDKTDVDQRLSVARLFLQGERYTEARTYLERIRADFPELEAEITPQIQQLRQATARRLLLEIDDRRSAGQHQLVLAMLKQFPAEGVAGETLRQVRELLGEFRRDRDRRVNIVKRLAADIEAIRDSVLRDRAARVLEEIRAELSINTVDRLAAYEQFADDASLSPEQKVAFAVSGWITGADAAQQNLVVALSLYDIRDLVHRFLNTPQAVDRKSILKHIRSSEGASCELVSRMLQHMKPPLETPAPPQQTPGFYELTVPTVPGMPDSTYYVQLPPEYDPHRRYPAVLTLHGGRTTPQLQIDWWAGAANARGQRLGQATRKGYIVIAPAWAADGQTGYRFSNREHATVLHTLRDACRRFAIDTDRVFLSGHSMGGDASWDIGWSHPDLWAGVVSVSGAADRFCNHYVPNGRYMPVYSVVGELDRVQVLRSAPVLDPSFVRHYDVTVAEFLGRGHEHFSDEIFRIFDWMGRRSRDFFPQQFECKTMRPSDNFFWWIELEDLPKKTQVDPADWPPPRGTRPLDVKANVTSTNGLNIRAGAGHVSVWLSPELIDFSRRSRITINGRRLNVQPEPDVGVLLDDVRTRGDRQHAFWAYVETPSRRR